MNKIELNDLEKIRQNEQEVLELEKKIEKLNDVKNFKKIKKEIFDLYERKNKLSIYELKPIGEIIAKLMTKFEGVKYFCKKNDGLFYGYYITHGLFFNNIDYLHPRYKLTENDETENFSIFSKKEFCYLPPSITIDSNDEISYIQIFINYLYKKRSEEDLYEISDEKLNEILLEFLEMTTDLQQQRKEAISIKKTKLIEEQKRKEFEKSCIIDRKLILSSLAYIFNNYEENMSSKLETKSEQTEVCQFTTLTCYQILTINFNNKQLQFKAEIDSETYCEDEIYCKICVDHNKDTNICFFDIKKTLLPALKESKYAIKFMDMIETLYNDGIIVTHDKIQKILVLIKNSNKSEQKILKKDIKK